MDSVVSTVRGVYGNQAEENSNTQTYVKEIDHTLA